MDLVLLARCVAAMEVRAGWPVVLDRGCPFGIIWYLSLSSLSLMQVLLAGLSCCCGIRALQLTDLLLAFSAVAAVDAVAAVAAVSSGWWLRCGILMARCWDWVGGYPGFQVRRHWQVICYRGLAPSAAVLAGAVRFKLVGVASMASWPAGGLVQWSRIADPVLVSWLNVAPVQAWRDAMRDGVFLAG